MMKKISHKCSSRQILTCGNDNVRSHDQEEIKLNSTININSGANTFTHD